MKKIGKYIVVLLVVAIFAGTFAYLYKRSKPKETQYPELEATVGTIVKSTVLTGKIQPRDEDGTGEFGE